MPTSKKLHEDLSPLSIFKELTIEGASTLVEAQRTLLHLAQRENDIVMNGIKERTSSVIPLTAMTDLVQRSLDTFIGMQQDFLTTASRQALQWLGTEEVGTSSKAQLIDLAREAVETFARAQRKFIDVLAEDAELVTGRKHQHETKPLHKTDLAKLAHEAGNAFIEAQKRILEVMGQQMTVNMAAANRTMEMLSPSRFLPVANLAGERIKTFVDAEQAFIGSLVMPRKQPKVAKPVSHRRHAARRRETAAKEPVAAS